MITQPFLASNVVATWEILLLGPGHTELESRRFQSKDFCTARESRSHYVFQHGAFDNFNRGLTVRYHNSTVPKRPHVCILTLMVTTPSRFILQRFRALSFAQLASSNPLCLRKSILAENESQELQHRHAADREVSDPPESSTAIVVIVAEIQVSVHLRRAEFQHGHLPLQEREKKEIRSSDLAPCQTHDCTTHKARSKKGRRSVSKSHTVRLEKTRPWKRSAAIQNLLDRIGRAGAILTHAILSRLMRKIMRMAMEMVIV